MEVVTICTTYFNAKNHIMSGQFVQFSGKTTICSLNIIKQPMFFLRKCGVSWQVTTDLQNIQKLTATPNKGSAELYLHVISDKFCDY
jgi:hypothetical protein